MYILQMRKMAARLVMTVFMVSVSVAEGPRDVDPYLGVYEGV